MLTAIADYSIGFIIVLAHLVAVSVRGENYSAALR
jgi:hypothetical protein